MRDVDNLRQGLEAFGEALALVEWDNLVGLRDDVDTEAVYARYGHLFSVDALRRLGGAADAAPDPREARRLRFLEDDVLGAVVGDAFREEADRLQTDETRAVVRVGGERIPFRGVGIRIEEEADRTKRARLKAATDGVKARFLPRVEDLTRRERAFVEDLGYPDDATWWSRVQGLDPNRMDTQLQEFLRRTGRLYERVLGERLAAEVNVPLAEAASHDVAFLMRGKRFDGAFPKDRVVPLFHGFSRRLGFDVDALGNVTLDLVDRPTKDDRAFVLPVRTPSDVRLCTRPRGGADDYRGILHEAGHLLHFAHTRSDLPYEDRYHGDDGVTESYAFLFEHLLENPRFLADAAPRLQGSALEDYLAWCGLDKLMGLRSYGAALHYDLYLARHTLEEAKPVYVDTMTRAMKIPANPLNYLSTDGFYGMAYLRAWIFEAMHRQWLENRFGERWWRDPAVGAHLNRLYAQGTAPTVEELAGELGYTGLTMEPLLEDLERLLGARA